MATDNDVTIAIVGGGAWGLSAAYHLVKAGYTNITVFERGQEIPSPHSAANVQTKIVRAHYDTDFYTDLGLVSLSVSRLLEMHVCSIYSFQLQD
jgi:sarcosine oxidase/L-pipecolate oxidase